MNDFYVLMMAYYPDDERCTLLVPTVENERRHIHFSCLVETTHPPAWLA